MCWATPSPPQRSASGRVSCTPPRTTLPRSALKPRKESAMRLGLIILAGALAALTSQSLAAEDELTGTLKKMRDSRSVTLGVRENSIPFSFANPGGRPVGYSVDLCQE